MATLQGAPKVSRLLRLLWILLPFGLGAALLWPVPAPLARAHSVAGAHAAAGDSNPLAARAPAGPPVVTNTNDSGSGSLRDVVFNAIPGDTVIFSLTLPATIVLTGGGIPIAITLTISGPGSDLLTISGNHASNIFTVDAGQVEIDGVTLRDGQTTAYGAGVNVRGGSLTLLDSSLISNTANSGGGGIDLFGGASLSVGNSVFMSNTSSSGAAIQVLTGTATIVDSTFSGNTANQGGAISSNSLTSMFVRHSTLVNNRALLAGNPGRGGAIESLGTLRVEQSTIRGNHADNAAGGIDVNYSTAVISDTTLAGNSSNGGGAIDDNGVLTITGSTLSGNKATGVTGSRGGALAVEGGYTATLINSTVSGNTANDDAGGIYINAGGALNLIAVTIANNIADADHDGTGAGGGLANTYVSGKVNLSNTIIAGNSANSGVGPDCLGAVNSGDYNLIQNPADCTLGGSMAHNIIGQAARLSPLGNYGGPTQTQGPYAGSPALDKISPPANGCGTTLQTDQRGAVRPQNGACDIGAYEGSLTPLWLPLLRR